MPFPRSRTNGRVRRLLFLLHESALSLRTLSIQKEGHRLSKRPRVYFLTAYVEYLLDQGIRSEEYYLGDASRYLRFLLSKSSADDVELFIRSTAKSRSYETRLRKTLRKFHSFAEERLGIKTASIR